jgi:hypothetical protein
MSSDNESVSTMDNVMSTIKTLESAELFKLIKTIVSEVEKKTKQTTKTTSKAVAAKKTGSMPKGSIPPQLKKPRAWVEYTLKHALENGWESFTIHQTHKDKETGEKTEEVIEMPGSILHDGAHVYADSVNEKNPAGKQLIHKDAMSLSKQRKESNHPTYAEFEAQYVDDTPDDDKSTTSSKASSVKSVVKKTAAEKEAEKEAKKAEKEAEKAAKKAEKEAEKEAKKAEKEAEKAAKKAEKEAEKAAKKAEKETAKKPAVKAATPAAAVKKATPAKEEKPVEKPVAAAAAPKKKPVAKVEEIPADGMVHPCTINGKQYFRNSDGETWVKAADGSCGAWAGMYDAATNTLDASAPEPEFSDEE